MLFCIVTFNLWLHYNKLLTYYDMHLCIIGPKVTIQIHYYMILCTVSNVQ